MARRILRNRYNPRSRFVSVRDIWLNLKEEVYCWWHRVPPGARIRWIGRRVDSYESDRPDRP